MSDINKYTTKEVLNKVLLDSSGNAVNAYSHTSQEAFNAALDDANSRLNVNLVGGTIGGDVTITGDLTVNGGGSLAFDEIIQGTQVIDVTNTEALLVRKNDDGGDVFVVDTTNSKVSISTSAKYGTLTVGGSGEVLSLRSSSGASELHFYEGGTTRGVISSLNGSDGLSLKSGTTERMRITSDGKVGIGTTSPSVPLHVYHGTSNGVALFESGDASAGIALKDNSTSNNVFLLATGDNFGIQTGGVADRLVVDSSGDVTFGNTAIFANNKSINFLNTSGAEKAIITFDSSNITKIGDASSSGTLQLNSGDATFAGDVTVNGAIKQFRDDSSTVGTNDVVIENDGGGDVSLKFSLTGATNWFVYVDNNDSDKFKIRRSTTDHLSIDESGNATFGGNATVNGDTLSLVKSNNNAFLKIESTDGGEAIFEMRATTNRTNQIRFFEGATQRGSIVYAHASQSLTFNTGDSATAKLVLDDNSRISLGNNDSGGGTTNTIFGRLAGNQMASGAAHNTAIGSSALDGMLTGTHNTAIGSDAMGSADGGEAENTAVGYRAMFNNNNGLGNTCIGAGTNLSAVNGQGQIAIGKDVSCIANETATLGFGSNVASLGLDGSDTSWAASSDERLKENIADSTAGLDVINDLRPVTYNWKKAKDIDKSMPQYKDSDEPVLGKEYGESLHGFIAQEVKVVIDKHDSLKEGFKMWKQSNDGTQTIADGNLIPILVKAVQELSARVKELENN